MFVKCKACGYSSNADATNCRGCSAPLDPVARIDAIVARLEALDRVPADQHTEAEYRRMEAEEKRLEHALEVATCDNGTCDHYTCTEGQSLVEWERQRGGC